MSNDLSLSTRIFMSMCMAVALILITITAALVVKGTLTGTLFNPDCIVKVQTTLEK